MSELEFIACLLFFVSAIVCGSIIQWIHSKIKTYKPPVSILWFIFGIIICTIEIYLVSKNNITIDTETNPVGLMSLGIAQISRLNHYGLYFVILPLLLYDATQMVDWYYFRKHIQSGILLAVLGVVVQVVIIGYTMRFMWGNELDLAACFLVASAVSATDPIAVIALLEELDASVQLVSVFDTESLINDGSSIFLFMFFRHYLKQNQGYSGIESLILFLRLLFVGPIWGCLVAAITYRCIKHYRIYCYDITLLVVSMAYLTFLIAEYYLHTSGPLTIVAFGLYFKAYARAAFENNTSIVHNNIIRGVSTGFMSIVFIISGIACTRIIFEIYSHHLTLIVDNVNQKSLNEYESIIMSSPEFLPFNHLQSTASSNFKYLSTTPQLAHDPSIWNIPLFFIIVQLARLFMISIFYKKLCKDVSIFSVKQALLVWWGGLRGAVCLILALLLEQEQEFHETYVIHATLYIASFTVLSLLINGTTFELLYKFLQPFGTNPFKIVYLKRVLTLIEEDCEKELDQLHTHWLFENSNIIYESKNLVCNLKKSEVHSFYGLLLKEINIDDALKLINIDSLYFQKSYAYNTESLYMSHTYSNLDSNSCIDVKHTIDILNPNQVGTNTKSDDVYYGIQHSFSNFGTAMNPTTEIRQNSYYNLFSDIENQYDNIELIHRSITMPNKSSIMLKSQTWEKEGEVIAMIMNCIRNMYKALHDQGFLSGINLVKFLSDIDLITDYAMINKDKINSMNTWKGLMLTPNLLDECIEQNTLRFYKHKLVCRDNWLNKKCTFFNKKNKEFKNRLIKSFIMQNSAFDIEWKLLSSSLRCIKRSKNYLKKVNISNNFIQKCIVKIWSFIGPRQIFPALDDLQAIIAYSDVHQKLLDKANNGIQFILGPKLSTTYITKIRQARRSAIYLYNFYPQSYVYALLALSALFIVNIKIKLTQEYFERGLLLETDKNKIIFALKNNVANINNHHPYYAFS